MKILERRSTPTSCYTKWDDEGFVGAGIKIRTYEERVQELVKRGVIRSDAQSVVDAEDAVNKGLQFETFSFLMRWYRQEKLDEARKIMFNNMLKKETSSCS